MKQVLLRKYVITKKITPAIGNQLLMPLSFPLPTIQLQSLLCPGAGRPVFLLDPGR